MTIHPSVLRPRIPRLGTITTGYGVEATSRAGSSYSRPTKSDTLVFHTNDEEAANAVAAALGGRISEDSPTWQFDVITGVRSAKVEVLVAGFRQSLESWRAGQCARRCDGVTMSVLDGKPTSQPCLCEQEMARGAERQCDPHTTLPVLVELNVDRLGVWEVKSTSWGTASNIAGALDTLRMMGVTAVRVPAILSMADRKVRDASDDVWEVTELHLTLAARMEELATLTGATRPAEVDGAPKAALPAAATPENSEDDEARNELLANLTALRRMALDYDLRTTLASDWKQMFPDRSRPSELTNDELEQWVRLVHATVTDAAQAAQEQAAEPEQPPLPNDDDEVPF